VICVNLSKLKKVLAVSAIVCILFATNGAGSFAEVDQQKMAIIKNCEQIYHDLEMLGTEKFKQRYMYNKDLRTCLQLYSNFAWASNDPDRLENLADAIVELTYPKSLRDRHAQSQAIPKWIKDDATRWYKGEAKDSLLSYGIRHLIESKMIQAQPDLPRPGQCHDELCVFAGDYMAYSVSEDGKDNVTFKHTIQNVNSEILVVSSQITKEGRTTEYLSVGKTGLLKSGAGCCSFYQFAHKMPLEMGSEVDSIKKLKVTHEVIFPIKDFERPAFIAKDSLGYYQEVIDRDTGIVLFAKNQDNIRKVTKITALTDTNAFSREVPIDYERIHIPSWFREPAKWWTQGIITDGEYVSSLSYLINNNILRI